MGVHFDSSNIRDLAADFERVPSVATKKVARAVESTAKRGNTLAQNFARSSEGKHGKYYHRSFEAESAGLLGLSWVYGPRVGPPQGGMSFEWGSRNQPPHLDLNRSADVIGPFLQKSVGDAIGESLDGG